jgi:hypothetical protein
MVGEIISEWRARSNRNGGRDHSGIVGDIERNQQTEAVRNSQAENKRLQQAKKDRGKKAA